MRVGELAEAQKHHPDIFLAWGRVKLTLWTHKIDGLTEGVVVAKPGSLPLSIAVAQVIPIGGRLWVLLDAKAGPWKPLSTEVKAETKPETKREEKPEGRASQKPEGKP